VLGGEAAQRRQVIDAERTVVAGHGLPVLERRWWLRPLAADPGHDLSQFEVGVSAVSS
jgi:hypothetical protein